jgi:hypothetical protein
MKKILPLVLLSLVTCHLSLAQTNPPAPPVGIVGVGAGVADTLARLDESTNLFGAGEIEFRLGGVYVQQTSEAAALLSITKWDVLVKDVGLGIEVIESDASGTMGTFGYLEYRKTYGNVGGGIFAGGGYDNDRDCPMGVVGGRVYYRWSRHLGSFISAGWAIEDSKGQDGRGLITGGGFSYAF